MSETACPRFGRWIGSCRFEARYDLAGPPAASLRALPSLAQSVILLENDVDALRVMSCKTYVRDVCARCGKTVERTK